MAKPKIIYVKSWKDIPLENADRNTRGMTSPDGTIYIVKGKYTKKELEHEKFHLKQGHRWPKTPEKYIAQERDAELHTLKKLGGPARNISLMRMWMYYIANNYDITMKKASSIIKESLDEAKDVPEGWKKSAKKLLEESAYIDENYYKELREKRKAAESSKGTLAEAMKNSKRVVPGKAETTVQRHLRRNPRGGSKVEVRQHRRRLR